MRPLMAAVLAVFVIGCGKAQPTLAGGKPVSYWVRATHSPDAKLRKEAVFKLGNVGPTDATVYPAVVEALTDIEPKVRCEAILALVKCGPKAKEAIPVLEKMEQHDLDPKTREYAGKALRKLNGL